MTKYLTVRISSTHSMVGFLSEIPENTVSCLEWMGTFCENDARSAAEALSELWIRFNHTDINPIAEWRTHWQLRGDIGKWDRIGYCYDKVLGKVKKRNETEVNAKRDKLMDEGFIFQETWDCSNARVELWTRAEEEMELWVTETSNCLKECSSDDDKNVINTNTRAHLEPGEPPYIGEVD